MLRPILVNHLATTVAEAQTQNSNAIDGTAEKKKVHFPQQVMDDAEAKENLRPVTPENSQKPRDSDRVGSGSTWGAKERDKFRIITEKNQTFQVKELIGEEWFDFTTLDSFKRDLIEELHSSIKEPSREAILAKDFRPSLYKHDWRTFRKRLRQIYRLETGAAADVKSNLGKERRERSRIRNAQLAGLKSAEGNVPGTRVASASSNISDEADSSGGGLVVYTNEIATNELADSLIETLLVLWDDRIPLSFAPKERPIGLEWQAGPSNADFSFGVKHGQDDYHRIWALNDGCLRFVFEPRDSDRVSNWPRQAACLLLEAKRIKIPKTQSPPDPDPRELSKLTFPENLFVGQIVAEMLTMVCHQRLRGIDQEAFVIHAYHSQLRLFYCHYPAQYIIDVLDNGEPSVNITVRKSKAYEMLEPQDRVDFMDVLIALFRKIEAGQVRTGFAWEDFPGNPVMSIANASQTMEMEMDVSSSFSPPSVPSRSASPDKKSRETRGRSRDTKSSAIPKSASTIRKSSRSPVKRSTLINAVDNLQISRGKKPAT